MRTGCILQPFAVVLTLLIALAAAIHVAPSLRGPGQSVMHHYLIAHAASAPAFAGYSAPQIARAYNYPTAPPAAAPHQTVAIVDAGGAPTLEADLAVYDQTYGLPPCTSANGCLHIVNQDGGADLPAPVSDWHLEIALDVETVHGACPSCSILLVESAQPDGSLDTAVQTAIRMGATEVSLSWGGAEEHGAISNPYKVRGVAIVASAGDSGHGVSWPASIPEVVSVGGTSLTTDAAGLYGYERVWSGTGGGCAHHAHIPPWQQHRTAVTRLGCAHRMLNDVSADADPNTGEAVYDSTPDGDHAGWWQVGGTSLSAPLIASAFALAGGVNSNVYAPSVLYRWGHRFDFHDVQGGSNGSCPVGRCTAIAGYDGPTGVGSANGVGGFVSRHF